MSRNNAMSLNTIAGGTQWEWVAHFDPCRVVSQELWWATESAGRSVDLDGPTQQGSS